MAGLLLYWMGRRIHHRVFLVMSSGLNETASKVTCLNCQAREFHFSRVCCPTRRQSVLGVMTLVGVLSEHGGPSAS